MNLLVLLIEALLEDDNFKFMFEASCTNEVSLTFLNSTNNFISDKSSITQDQMQKMMNLQFEDQIEQSEIIDMVGYDLENQRVDIDKINKLDNFLISRDNKSEQSTDQLINNQISITKSIQKNSKIKRISNWDSYSTDDILSNQL